MKNILNGVGMVLGVLIMCAVMCATVIGLGFGITKSIELLNIEVGLTKAFQVYVYFVIILIIYYVPKSLIKHELIKSGNTDIFGNLSKNPNFNVNIKRARIVYNIFGICASVIISWLLHSVGSVFIFFLITPVALYGINKGLDEVSKMTIKEKEKYIIDSISNESKYGSDL